MGVAATQRGSDCIRKQLADTARPIEFRIMDRLNSLSKYSDAGNPPENMVFAEDKITGFFWALQKDKMWSGFGFWYETLSEAVKRWNCHIIGYDSINNIWLTERIK